MEIFSRFNLFVPYISICVCVCVCVCSFSIYIVFLWMSKWVQCNFNSFSDQFVLLYALLLVQPVFFLHLRFCFSVLSWCIFPSSSSLVKRRRKKNDYLDARKRFFTLRVHFVNYIVYNDNAIKMVDYEFDYNNLHILMHFVNCAYHFFLQLVQFVRCFPVWFLFCFRSFFFSFWTNFKWFKSEKIPSKIQLSNQTFSLERFAYFRFHLTDNYFSISIIIIIITIMASKCVFIFSAIAFMPSTLYHQFFVHSFSLSLSCSPCSFLSFFSTLVHLHFHSFIAHLKLSRVKIVPQNCIIKSCKSRLEKWKRSAVHWVEHTHSTKFWINAMHGYSNCVIIYHERCMCIENGNHWFNKFAIYCLNSK